MELAALTQMDIEHLEMLYQSESESWIPNGAYKGYFLTRLDSPTKRKPYYLGSRLFEYVPFGINFCKQRWFFLNERLRAGKFRMDIGTSRWRPTLADQANGTERDNRVIRLLYNRSHLPDFLKNSLYDEVKPLTEKLCLGIGGFNFDAGLGDQFFFALVKR